MGKMKKKQKDILQFAPIVLILTLSLLIAVSVGYAAFPEGKPIGDIVRIDAGYTFPRQ